MRARALIDATLLRRVAARTLVFAAIAVALIGLRVLERGEGLQPRTLMLLAMAAGGAFPAGAAVLSLAAVARGWPALLRGALAAPLLSAAFSACAALTFWLVRPTTESDFDHDEHHLLEVVGMLIDAAGLFAVTGTRYWLPWPVAAIGLAGGVLAALPWRAARSAPEPEGLHGRVRIEAR